MQIKKWFREGNLDIEEVKEYTNKITGQRDPMFIHKIRSGGTSFIHASSLTNYVLIMDDGRELSISNWMKETEPSEQ